MHATTFTSPCRQKWENKNKKKKQKNKETEVCDKGILIFQVFFIFLIFQSWNEGGEGTPV